MNACLSSRNQKEGLNSDTRWKTDLIQAEKDKPLVTELLLQLCSKICPAHVWPPRASCIRISWRLQTNYRCSSDSGEAEVIRIDACIVLEEYMTEPDTGRCPHRGTGTGPAPHGVSRGGQVNPGIYSFVSHIVPTILQMLSHPHWPTGLITATPHRALHPIKPDSDRCPQLTAVPRRVLRPRSAGQTNFLLWF